MLLVASVLCLAGASVPAVGSSTAQVDPPVTLAGATVTVDVGEPRRVDATYRFRIGGSGGGTGTASRPAIDGTVWRFPGREVDALTARVDGTPVDPEVTREARHLRVSVPVPDDATDRTVVVRIRYRVEGPAGRLRLPLWVPTARPAGVDRIVEVTVRLPDGTRVQSAAFPTVGERRDGGTVLVTRLPQMPGLVALRYGPGSPGLTLDRAVGLAGVGTLVGLGAAWAVARRREGPRVA